MAPCQGEGRARTLKSPVLCLERQRESRCGPPSADLKHRRDRPRLRRRPWQPVCESSTLIVAVPGAKPVRTPCSDRETRGFMVCRTAAAVALLLLASSAPAGQTKGHPLITPYQGSQINGNETQTYDYEEVRIPTGKRDEKDPGKSDAAVAGKVTRIEYDNPPGRSSLEIYRNYLDAFSKGGFKILFECAGDKCG